MTIDFSFITDAGFSNPFSATWFLIAHGGWVLVLFLLGWGAAAVYVKRKQNEYADSIEYVFLAIDVPKMTEQTPKAVESVFSHLHGIQKKGNWVDRNLHGYFQTIISFEIISVGGFIQFLVRTPTKFRDMVESTFYAQYPDAEISEVEDYTEKYHPVFPNDEYEIWGAEMKLKKPDVFPIRTYPMFEHTMTQQLLDPMASLLEFMSRMRPGEELWIQLLITPPDDESWLAGARKAIRKIAHATYDSKKSSGLVDQISWFPSQVIKGLTESFTANLVSPFGEAQTEEKKDSPSIMSFLTPDARETVTQIAYKAAKLYFESKIRVIYFGQKAVFDKGRIPGIVGAFKQFTSLDTNGFVVDKRTKTTVDYWRKEQREASRKRKLLSAYQERSMEIGAYQYVLNVEELASVYHFPVVTVKAPLVQKTEARKGEPPRGLPMENRLVRPAPEPNLPPDLPV